jgi:hypothetical protein
MQYMMMGINDLYYPKQWRRKMNTYDINDVLKVGNPLDDGSNFKCIKCNEKGELAFAPYPIIDWRCGLCGEWQQEKNNE